MPWIASSHEMRRGRLTFFLLDNPSIGGFSGAPVWMLPAVFPEGGSKFIAWRRYSIVDERDLEQALDGVQAFISQDAQALRKVVAVTRGSSGGFAR
jgi:hypothetical protein